MNTVQGAGTNEALTSWLFASGWQPEANRPPDELVLPLALGRCDAALPLAAMAAELQACIAATDHGIVQFHDPNFRTDLLRSAGRAARWPSMN